MKTLKFPALVFLFLILLQSLAHDQTFNKFVSVNSPSGLAFSPGGDLFVSSQNDNKVYKVTSAGVVTSYAIGLASPEHLVFAPDGSGNLFVVEFTSNSIIKIPPNQIVSTFATGLQGPFGIAADSAGNFYVSNFSGNSISKVTSTGVVTIFATGFGNPCGLTYSGGNLYVANRTTNSILKVTVPGGVVTTFATGLNQPQCVEYAMSTGYMFSANYGGLAGTTVSRITPGGIVQLYASGFHAPVDIAFDILGSMYVANFGDSSIYKSTAPTQLVQTGTSLPEDFVLKQNYPNPFNPSTNIEFSIPKTGLVKLTVFDMTGKEITILVNKDLNPGTYRVNFNASGLSSGIYLYELSVSRTNLRESNSSFIDTKKMMLVK